VKVVLDTNVLISAIFFSGTPARILAAWGDTRFDLLASVDILTEYRRVVMRLERQFL
jgi:predicted nucleic acid-binding protein